MSNRISSFFSTKSGLVFFCVAFISSAKGLDSMTLVRLDSVAIEARVFEKNRMLAKAIDDSIETFKSLKQLSMVGLVAGTALTLVGSAIGQVANQEKTSNMNGEGISPETAAAWNMAALFLGLPLALFSAYQYVSLDGKISVCEWNKRKLKLVFSWRGSMIAASF